MVLTRFQKSACVKDRVVFVDVSGSTAEYTTKEFLSNKVEELCDTNGDVSIYTSNHDLTQRYFLNPGKMIPRQTFSFGGLSAVCDNIIECIEYRFKHDHDTPCDVYIISDMDDNMSIYHTQRDMYTKIHDMNRFWNIFLIHPSEV